MFVRNPSGTVHSVPDDFQLPDEDWSEVTEAEAPAALLGETDPDAAGVELHNLSDTVVVDESGPAQEPGKPDERKSNDIYAAGGAIPAPEGVEATVEAGEVVTPEVTA